MDDCKPILTLKTSKTNFILIGIKQQLAKLHNCPIKTTHFAHNLAISDQVSSLSKSRYSHIHALHCIRPYLDFKTANTIATSIVHSKLDYCNSLYFNRLQQIQNSLARTVVKSPRFSHITPVLKSMHWLKVLERMEYKLLSLTQKVLTTSQPTYRYNFVQSRRSTGSQSVVTISRPPTSSTLKLQHPTSGINFLILSMSLIHILLFHLLTTLHTSDTHCYRHHSRHQSLLLCSTLDLPLLQVFSTIDFSIDTHWTDLMDFRSNSLCLTYRLCLSFFR